MPEVPAETSTTTATTTLTARFSRRSSSPFFPLRRCRPSHPPSLFFALARTTKKNTILFAILFLLLLASSPSASIVHARRSIVPTKSCSSATSTATTTGTATLTAASRRVNNHRRATVPLIATAFLVRRPVVRPTPHSAAAAAQPQRSLSSPLARRSDRSTATVTGGIGWRREEVPLAASSLFSGGDSSRLARPSIAPHRPARRSRSSVGKMQRWFRTTTVAAAGESGDENAADVTRDGMGALEGPPKPDGGAMGSDRSDKPETLSDDNDDDSRLGENPKSPTAAAARFMEDTVESCGGDNIVIGKEKTIDVPQPSSLSSPSTSSCTPPSSPKKIAAHYVFLVHGWLGNDLEMSYLETAVHGALNRRLCGDDGVNDEEVDDNDDDDDDDEDGKVDKTESRPYKSRDAVMARIDNAMTKNNLDGRGRHNHKRRRGKRDKDKALIDGGGGDDGGGGGNAPSHLDKGIAAAAASSTTTEPTAPIAARSPPVDMVVHKATCNVNQTHDGIEAGGTRLAAEVLEFITSDVAERRRLRRRRSMSSSIRGGGRGFESDGAGHADKRARRSEGEDRHRVGDDDGDKDGAVETVTISFVGNSLGGLYARHALSLLPNEFAVPLKDRNDDDNRNNGDGNIYEGTVVVIRTKPNVFCTTATPHLGVSQHTYLKIPRFAERVIGNGMRRTGRDLFRLDVASSSVAAGEGGDGGGGGENSGDGSGTLVDGANLKGIVYGMATEKRFLEPLAAFRKRVAYINAYGTDFQVPTDTAAFLSPRSDYPHMHYLAEPDDVRQSSAGDGNQNEESRESASFVAAVLHTVPRPLSSASFDKDCNKNGFASVKCDDDGGVEEKKGDVDGVDEDEDEDELLTMSTSLDALGWTKVFVDVRNRIPVPSVPKPPMLRSKSGDLDARGALGRLIAERHQIQLESSDPDDAGKDERKGKETTIAGSGNGSSPCVRIESRELVELMNPSDRMHFPLGHTVMVANSKSGWYSRLNARGRPVMDKLAADLVRDVMDFES